MQQVIRPVRVWLLAGILMVFIQILVGGITRLTESGLSITKWEVVSGTLPPLSQGDWLEEFEKYKETPQYKEINEGMNLSQFKFIYFWEYVHRLWARLMGFVFIIPFVLFFRKKWITQSLLKDLIVVIVLAACAAIFGWIMVASGLVNRPWVNAYKLSIHLIIAFSVFGYLLWTYFKYINGYPKDNLVKTKSSGSLLLSVFVTLFFIQLILGGMMSGMKIAVVYPEWPWMNNSFWPAALGLKESWSFYNLHNYDQNEFAPAFTHFFHRMTAYLLCVVFVLMAYTFSQKISVNDKRIKLGLILMGIALFLQAFLGIVTVINSVGKVPVFWGVAHQAGAACVLGTIIYFIFTLKKEVD